MPVRARKNQLVVPKLSRNRCALVRRFRTAFLTNRSAAAQAREKGRELEWSLKQHLEPLVRTGLEMAYQFEQAQFALVLLPHRHAGAENPGRR